MADELRSRRFRPLTWALKITFALFGLCLLATSVFYSPEIEGRVVMPNGEPVAGAIVVASWNIQEALTASSLGQVALIEVLTDRNGSFNIPAWGPRFVALGTIREDEPIIRVFKPGFSPLVLRNYEGLPVWPVYPVIKSRLDGKVLVLARFDGTADDYGFALQPLLDSLSPLFDNQEQCNWRVVPRLLLALEASKTKLMAENAGDTLRFAHQYAAQDAEPKCGDAERFFRSYRDGESHPPSEAFASHKERGWRDFRT